MKTFVTSDGVRLAYEEVGDGPPVVFIHGWAATRKFWLPAYKLDGYRKIFFDLRGHGDSERAKDYSLGRMVLDIKELIESLGLERVTLVGHSMGGVLASKLISFHPEVKAERIVLVATPPWIYRGRLSSWFHAVALRYFTPLISRLLGGRLFFRPRKDLLEFVWRESAKGSLDAYVKLFKEINGVNIVDDLLAFRGRKVAIVPLEDRIAPAEDQKMAYERACDVVLTIEEAGHNVMLEKPAEFAKKLEEALRA